MKQRQENTNTLMNFMGARLSKSGQRVNLTLVKGENENREYRNVSITLDKNSKNKVKAKIVSNDNGQYFALIAIPFFEDDNDKLVDEAAEQEAEQEAEVKKPVKKVVKKSKKLVDDSDMPF